MILPFSGRSCCSTLAFIAVLFALLSVAAANSPTPYTPSIISSNCSAEITVNSTQPSPHFYIYHDIIVENTGLCQLNRVFVNITLPPDDSVFVYYNVSNSTGELYGIASLPQGRVEVGGTIVMNSARLPIIVLADLECSSVCNAASPPSPGIPPEGNTPSNPSTELPSDPSAPPSGEEGAPSDTPVEAPPSAETPSDESPEDTSSGIQVEVKQGSNEYFFALSILSDGRTTGPRKVHFRDSSADASWVRMESANWGEATFTHSPTDGPLVLPISLRITLANRVTILDDVITSFSADTYSPSPATQVSQDIDA